MQAQEVKSTLSGFLQKDKDLKRNFLIKHIKDAYLEGRLDHNFIRKAVINCFKSHDHKSILFGSLLLQLDNKEISELFKENVS